MKDPVHKLAAIVFTDIVGYTAVTQQDELLALKLVQKHQNVIEHCAQIYGGEVLNYYGDGSLSMFSSVTDAIEAAGMIQEKMNSDLPVPLRVGIHLGEIYFKDGKFLGDGINIASRIQSEAETGQIYVSEEVYQTAKNKTNFTFEAVGTRELKNVDHPVKIHRVNVTDFTDKAKTKKRTKKQKGVYWAAALIILLGTGFFLIKQSSFFISNASDGISSILIMPFEEQNPSGEVNYFGLGIADEIRSKLSVLKQMEVKSRSSSMYLQGKNWQAKEIADELNVQYILEGTVRQFDNQVYLNLSLIDAKQDHLIQPIDYRGSMDADLIGMQNEIARTVIDLIKVSLLPEEQASLSEVATENINAYKYYLMGLSYLIKGSLPEYQRKAQQYFHQAIEEDEIFAAAYAGLAEVLMLGAGMGYRSTTEAIESARAFAEKGYKLNQNLAKTNQALGTIYWHAGDFTRGERILKKAIEIDPSLDFSYAYLAFIYRTIGNHNKAKEFMKKAIQLNPFSPIFKVNYMLLFIDAEQYKEAISLADSYLVDHPQSNVILFMKGIALTMQGSYDEAIETYMERPVETRAYNWMLGYTYALKGDTAKAREVLNYLLDKAEHTYISPAQIACIYMGLGEMEKMYEWMKKEDSIYFKTFPMFKHLYNNPNLQETFAFMKPFLD